MCLLITPCNIIMAPSVPLLPFSFWYIRDCRWNTLSRANGMGMNMFDRRWEGCFWNGGFGDAEHKSDDLAFCEREVAICGKTEMAFGREVE